jgi:hypothetical protein
MFFTPLFFNSPGMTFRKWWDDRVCILVEPHVCPKQREETYKMGMGPYVAGGWLRTKWPSMNVHAANNGNEMIPVIIPYADGEEGEEGRMMMIMASLGIGV